MESREKMKFDEYTWMNMNTRLKTVLSTDRLTRIINSSAKPELTDEEHSRDKLPC